MNRCLVFWLWNDHLEAEEIRRQIYEFHRQHIDGFFIHAMPDEFRPRDFHGGMPGYLSEEYFEMFRTAVACAKELNMSVWLYDEGGWPSGNVNGLLPREYPELRMHHIKPDGELVEFSRIPDLLNPKSTELFLSLVHEKYKKHFSAEFGKTIPGIFTDEPFFGNVLLEGEERMLPWSPFLAERFQNVKGYDAKEAAMRIFHKNDPQARQDYFEIWQSLIIDNFLVPIRNWCHENNLLFTGHFNGDDNVDNMKQLLTCNILALLDQLDIPGCDAIWRQIHPLFPETDFPRLTSSAAGNRITISESFAVYGTDLSLAEMKWVAAVQAVAGIRMVAPMAIHYSNRGGRQVCTDSNFFGADPRWEFYHNFCDFTRRMSKVFDRTTPILKAHVPFPVTELRKGSCAGNDIFAKGLALAKKQITYDYVPDAPEFSGEILPDLRLTEPVPALRTRHLKSPRGQRFILMNYSLETIRFRFYAPEGFNVWYDPATGKRTPACADSENLLSLELPFAGTIILLNLPGKPQKKIDPAIGKTERIPLEFKFEQVIRAVAGSENGLIEIPVPETPGKDCCGTIRYSAAVTVGESKKAKLLFPMARRSLLTIRLNGKTVTELPWAPYCCELELQAGENIISADLTTTAAPAILADSHTKLLTEKGFSNSYHKICMEFEKLFPEEEPFAGVQLEFT